VKTENKTNQHTNNTPNIVVKGNTKIKEKKRLPKRKDREPRWSKMKTHAHSKTNNNSSALLQKTTTTTTTT